MESEAELPAQVSFAEELDWSGGYPRSPGSTA
jgi:hypothetical protein